MAEFEFGQAANPASPTNGNWIPGPDGEPLNDFVPGIEFDNFTWNQQGGGSWTADQGEPSFMTIGMPNIEDDFPVKYIRVQITWRYPGQSGPPQFDGITGMDAEDGPLTAVSVFNSGTTGIGGNMRQSFYDIRVRPNPDWEIIRFGVPGGMSIIQVVVDTISVPEEQDAHAAAVEAIHGMHVSGALEDTFGSDGAFLVYTPSITIGPINDPPVNLVFSTVCPCQPGWDFVGLEFTLESRVTTPGITQTMEFYNWSTDEYDLIAEQPAAFPSFSQYLSVELENKLISSYVNSVNGEVRTRVGWRQTGPVLFNNWNVVIDWINWKFAMGFYE
jgi:hypothetical protein